MLHAKGGSRGGRLEQIERDASRLIDQADRALTLDDYINGYLDRCVDFIRDAHGVERINLLGICQGGAFSLCYASLHPEKVRNLVTMVTPVDFKTPDNMLSHWVQNVDIDLLVDTQGNIPGEMLNWTFLNLKPYQLMAQKYLGVVDLMDDPNALENFMRMEKWIFDSPDQVGETFRQFAKDFFQQNKLMKEQHQHQRMIGCLKLQPNLFLQYNRVLDQHA